MIESMPGRREGVPLGDGYYDRGPRVMNTFDQLGLKGGKVVGKITTAFLDDYDEPLLILDDVNGDALLEQDWREVLAWAESQPEGA